MLNILGYDAGEMDGYPGPQTRNALMAFQAEKMFADNRSAGQRHNKRDCGDRADLNADCPGQPDPHRIVWANAPLMSGKYVKDLEQCKS